MTPDSPCSMRSRLILSDFYFVKRKRVGKNVVKGGKNERLLLCKTQASVGKNVCCTVKGVENVVKGVRGSIGTTYSQPAVQASSGCLASALDPPDSTQRASTQMP